jgi:dTDP-4-dehydrorhamnose 3,5-epimerase
MFEFIKTEISEVILIKSQVFNDERGFFMETCKKSEFALNGIKDNFVQDNHSQSSHGVLRGLHYQEGPKAQAKLVRCIVGEIFDVAVDLRKNSPTYLKWVGYNLSADNKQQLYIPAGFAHGFCTLSEKAEIVYKCSEEYSPEKEKGIIWNDPSINILWPIKNPIMSPKDLKNAVITDLI